MEIKIFNVSHGFCAYVIADNGNVMLFDCGHNSQTGFRPSNYLPLSGCSAIERMFFLNYDEDHLNDLPGILAKLPIGVFHRNRSISAYELLQLKRQVGSIQPGMRALLGLIGNSGPEIIGYDEFPGVEIETFCNSYPQFSDTNNLSLVVFLHWGGIHIIFPGDLEKPGWEALLQNSNFQSHLSRVNIFIAPHHGRQSGYCAEAFDYCDPEIIIISDEPIKYGTQTVDYRKYAKGIPWNGGDPRYVLTTRKDGMITISDPPGYSFYVTTTN